VDHDVCGRGDGDVIEVAEEGGVQYAGEWYCVGSVSSRYEKIDLIIIIIIIPYNLFHNRQYSGTQVRDTGINNHLWGLRFFGINLLKHQEGSRHGGGVKRMSDLDDRI
jgi:hypothetical protein